VQVLDTYGRSPEACHLAAVLLPHIRPVVDLLAQIVGSGHASPDHLVFVQKLDYLVGMLSVASEVLVLDEDHINALLFVIGQHPLDALQRDDIGLIAEDGGLAELAAHRTAPGGEHHPVDVQLDIEGRIEVFDQGRMDDVLDLSSEIRSQLPLRVAHEDAIELILNSGGQSAVVSRPDLSRSGCPRCFYHLHCFMGLAEIEREPHHIPSLL